MRKFFTLILSVLLVSGAFAQRPEAIIKRTDVKPVLDGVIEDVWAMTDSLSIERPFTGTVPTLGDAGETYWKMLWDDDGLFLLVNVTDNEYFPNYVKGSGNAWDYDKLEIYFDVNYVLEDGKGPSAANSGHIQMAPDLALAKEGGQLNTETNTRQHAFLVTKPNYVAEYFVPWASLKDKDGAIVDKSGTIGFDVTVNDSDPEDDTRRRSVWANDNSDGLGEAWSNMDACGYITFEGAEAPVYIQEIALTVDGAITGDNQTLQIMAEVLPEDASDKTVKWVLTSKSGGAVRARISSAGVITPVVNEVLIVQAVSPDGFVYSNELEVSISGQIPTLGELSYIIDGFFDDADSTGKVSSVWDTWANAIVTDGVLMFGPDEVLADPWSYHLQQTTHIPFALKDLDYVISFKAWADAPRNMPLVLEDGYNDGAQWDTYFSSTNEYWDGSKTYMIPLTTTPTVFTLHANFGPMKETTIQAFNWQVGKETPKMYLDSVYIISEADMALIPTAISQVRAMESFKVYPNPATSKLNIELSTINSKVEIYNSLGVKMDEAVVFGNRHMFDVSAYAKGLYFVKANGAVIKFIK